MNLTGRVRVCRSGIRQRTAEYYTKRSISLLLRHPNVLIQNGNTTPFYLTRNGGLDKAFTDRSCPYSTSSDAPQKAMPLKLLPRPLGIREPPQWTPLNSEEKHKRFWDPKEMEDRREVLMKLNHEAYYADVHKLNFHGGKRWIAPEQLIKEDRALYFPDLSGKPLAPSPPPFSSESAEQRRDILLRDGSHIPMTNGKIHTAQMARNNVSLIAISHSQISAEHIKAWSAGLTEKWRGHERFRFIQVNLQQNYARSLLVSLFTSNLRRQVPKYFQQSYFVSYDNIDYIRDAIGLENKYVGYVYLVDWEGRIRWAGCGGPWNGDGGQKSPSSLPDTAAATSETPDSEVTLPEGGKGGQVSEGLVSGFGEVQRLEVCTKVLMGRLEKLIGEGKVS